MKNDGTAIMTPFVLDVLDELERAEAKHAPLNSLHEAYAVLLEEVDELWDEVRKQTSKRDPAAIRMELVQIAAVAIRAALNLGYDERQEPAGGAC